MKKLALLALLSLWVSACHRNEQAAAAASADAPVAGNEKSKDADIRHLLDLTGAGKIGVQVMEQMIGTFRKSMPTVPATFWDDFQRQINPQELVDLVVPIYASHFTDGDVKQLIAFYETPAGKKFIAATPSITQESMAAGQKWGQQVAQSMIVELQKKGLSVQPVAK